MAAPAQEPLEPRLEPSFDLLGKIDRPWTAQMALDLLPENNGPKVEVLYGSVVVSPHAGYIHQAGEVELAYRLRQAAKAVGLWGYPECNVVRGEDLFIPDFAVLRRSGRGQITMPIGDVLLIGEIVSRGSRRKDLIDRPREYAASGVPYFMRVDFRNEVPAIVLHELADEEYRPIVAAAAGETFVMTKPFAFTVDPADLLDEQE